MLTNLEELRNQSDSRDMSPDSIWPGILIVQALIAIAERLEKINENLEVLALPKMIGNPKTETD